MKIHSLSRTHGLVSLKQAEGKFFKRAILCRTGRWEGENGPVNVTQEMLQRLADKYNAERAEVLNENDYAPVLKDHVRKVDNVLGRIDVSVVKLTVEKIQGTKNQFGLFGDIRIDDEDAQDKVNKGKYAQLSLTFDDESDDIYEVSFVAVEGARRSQVLSRGERSMKTRKKKTHSLALFVSKTQKVQLALTSGVTKANTSVADLKTQLALVSTKLKTAGVKNQLSQFIREGKMTKAEMEKLDLVSLAAMDSKASSMVLGAYAARNPSRDIFQHGQEGSRPANTQLSSADFRKLAAAQKKGSTVSLSSGDDETEEAKKEALKKKLNNGDVSTEETHSLEMEDVKDIDGVIAKCLEGINAVVEQLNAIKSSADSLELDEKEQESLASGDEDEDEINKNGEE